MKKPYCCDASRAMFEDYYMRQQNGGGGMPVFSGARMQKGHGLGNILRGLFRKIVPFIQRNAKAVGTRALKTGMEIADDVLEGRSLKESASKRIPAGIKRMASTINWQTGSGVKRKAVRRKPKKKVVKRKKKDIWS
jgi:hypothetical protein